MEVEYIVLTFPNTARGQCDKLDALNRYSSKGWRVVSETIEQSNVDPVGASRDAACLCFLCGPFCTPFLMRKDKYMIKGTISVTLERSLDRKREEEQKELIEREARRRKISEDALEDSANLDSILETAKSQIGVFYPDSKIVKAIEIYLNQDRKFLGPVPSYAKSHRQGNIVWLVDSTGNSIAEYNFE